MSANNAKNAKLLQSVGYSVYKDFFVDEKVPRDERDRIPLITSGNDIIWVVGYRGDDRFMVTGSTKTVLRLEAAKLRD